MTSISDARAVSVDLIQKYMNGEELRAPKLNANKARAEYRMQYEFRKTSTSGETPMVNTSITSNGAPVYASTVAFNSLSRIGIKDLHLHVPAKGSYLLLRTLELPILVVGIMLFVEDHLGRVIIVTLYNYIDYDSKIPIEEVFPIGTTFIIKEPFLKLAVSGQIVIRCDCPTDFIVVNHNHPLYGSACNIKWKNSIDPNAVCKPSPRTALEWKESGNVLYKRKRFDGCVQAYLAALKVSNDPKFNLIIQLNISAAYLALEYFEDALKYAKIVLESHKDSVKALYRAGKSHYGLRQFTEALKMFDLALAIDPDLEVASEEKKRCVERLQEQEGKFDIYKLYLTSLLKPFTTIDFGEYKGPIQIAYVEGKGKGIIATEGIKAGTFLLVSKAFQAVFYTEMINSVAALSINYDYTMNHGNSVVLLSKTCQAVMKNPNTFGHAIYSLPTKDPFLDKSFNVFCDETNLVEPIADAGRLHKILTNNCFSLLHMKDQEQCFTTEKYTGSGLFIFASYFNHSCVSNAAYHTYNDVIAIRSTKFIRKGEEITVSYTAPREDFLKKEAKDVKKGVLCRCVLCILDRSEPKAYHKKRAALEQEHETLCDEHYNDPLINPSDKVKQQLNDLICKMEMTYAHRKELKLRLFSPYLRVAQGIAVPVELDKSYLEKVLEVVDKAFSTLGLSCDILLESLTKKDFSFPPDALLCQYSIYQALVFLVFRFQFIENVPLAQKWAKVLIKVHHMFTGGNVQMLRSQFKDSLPNLYLLLKSLE